jgi:tetratricopeptide (TPR) repeat protein
VDILAIIGVIAAVIGIPAAMVQILDYLHKRRQERAQAAEEDQASLLLTVPQIPHNLPPRSEFIGRETEKARVHEALRSRSYLVSIDGIGGIGKTVLALEVAHECLCASKGEAPTDGMATFDGFIWTTAKDRDLTLNALLDAIARTLEYPGIAQRPAEEKQVAVRKLLQEKPYLIIVDNFETITDGGVRGFLLNLPEPSKALITTREQKLRQVWSISLKGLAESEALGLIRSTGKRLGLRALEQGEDRVLRHLYNATGGAPLAIKWAVGQIKQRGQSLDSVLKALSEARGEAFDSIFTRSWDLLSENAVQILLVMPIFVTSATRAAIEAASAVHGWDLDEGLGQLVEMYLVEASEDMDESERRYGIHPLTRAFVQGKSGSLQHKVMERLTDHFLGFVQNKQRQTFPEIELDIANIQKVIAWCRTEKRWTIVTDFVRALYWFFETCGYWHLALDLGQQALEAAEELGWESEKAYHLRYLLGWFNYLLDDYDNAEEYTDQALYIFYQLHDEGQVAACHRLLGKIALRRDRLREVEKHLWEAWTRLKPLTEEWEDLPSLEESVAALAILGRRWHVGDQLTPEHGVDKAKIHASGTTRCSLEEGKDRNALARNLQHLGNLLSDCGDLLRALDHIQASLVLYRDSYRVHSSSPDEYLDIPYERGIVAVLDNWASAELEYGRIDEAEKHYNELRQRSKKVEQRRGMAHAYRGLGLVAGGKDNLTQARCWLRKAQDEYQRLGAKKELQETLTALDRVEERSNRLVARIGRWLRKLVPKSLSGRSRSRREQGPNIHARVNTGVREVTEEAES